MFSIYIIPIPWYNTSQKVKLHWTNVAISTEVLMPITYESEKTGRVLTWYRDFVDFPPHFHDTVEIVAVDSGSCCASVDFVEYKLGAGDIFIAFPGRIHSYSNEENIRCYTFLFPGDICAALSAIFDTKLPLYPVLRASDRTEQLFDTIRQIYLHNQKGGFYERQITRGYFAVLLCGILSSLELIDAPSSDPSTERRIIDYCMANFRSPLTLEVLSRELYISRHHISHLFSAKLKVGFNDFINQLRIREACSRLDDGESVTEAAFGSGFCSIRTFNRAFLKDRGMSPSEYIKITQIGHR